MKEDEKNSLRKVDTRSNLKVVTANEFITAPGLEQISLRTRKLLYLCIAQCQMKDDQFYEFCISVKDFCKLLDIKSTDIYPECKKVVDEACKLRLSIQSEDGKYARVYPVFQICAYEPGLIVFQLNASMTSMFLHLQKNFSQPLLADFLKMHSKFAIAIWHDFQKYMGSHIPDMIEEITFQISLDELRQVTGTKEKFASLGSFKRYVLDRAIKEIKDCVGVDITYENIKKGHFVVGFTFHAVSLCHITPSQKTLNLLRRFDLQQKELAGTITSEEKNELDRLTEEIGY